MPCDNVLDSVPAVNMVVAFAAFGGVLFSPPFVCLFVRGITKKFAGGFT